MNKHMLYVVLLLFILAVFTGCSAVPVGDFSEPAEDLDPVSEEPSLPDEPEEEGEGDYVDEVLVVAYSLDDSIMLSVGYNAPRQLTTGNQDYEPLISPDGSMILFKRISGIGDSGLFRFDLWLINADGSDARLLVACDDLPGKMGYMIDKPDPVTFDRIPMQISWLNDSSRILFNTELKVDYGMKTFDDLWYADVESGIVEQVLIDGSGGSFAIAPDSSAIIVADNKTVSIVDAGFSSREVILNFPMVNTASEFAFIPMPVWSPDSSYALIAIPGPEPYDFGEDLPELAIWKLFPSEEAALQCIVSGYNLWDAMSGELLSPDGLHFAYATGHFPDGDVHIARLDGSIVNTFSYAYDFMGWSTDGSLIILYADSSFLGGLDREQQELQMHEEVEGWNAHYKWVSPSTYVGLDFTYFLETTALWVTEIDGQSRIIDYSSKTFDAVLLK